MNAPGARGPAPGSDTPVGAVADNTSAAPFEIHVDVPEDGGSPVDCLSEASGLSRQRVKAAMTKGAVWLTRGRGTRRLRRATRVLASGDVLHLYHDERVLAMAPEPPLLIADEGAYSVWHKSRGMPSQGSKWGDHCTVTRWAEQHLTPPRSAFGVHRLDRAATGLIVVAHEKRVAAALARLFRERLVEKRYRVIVKGDVPASPSPLVLDAPVGGREACSRVVRLARDEGADRTLLDIAIETGRKHQIRVHLAGAGAPVVGDRLHGLGGEEDLQLTACLLGFDCPMTGLRKVYQLQDSLLPTLERGG